MNYIDTYITSGDENAIANFMENFTNVIPYQNYNGEFYGCIRTTMIISDIIPTDLAVVDKDTASQIIGTFL